MSAGDWLQLASRFGPIAVIALAILYLGQRKVWVWGYQLEECQNTAIRREERMHERADKWERMALKGTSLADTSTDIASKVIELAKEAQANHGHGGG